jgi:hypothetical protein
VKDTGLLWMDIGEELRNHFGRILESGNALEESCDMGHLKKLERNHTATDTVWWIPLGKEHIREQEKKSLPLLVHGGRWDL